MRKFLSICDSFDFQNGGSISQFSALEGELLDQRLNISKELMVEVMVK